MKVSDRFPSEKLPQMFTGGCLVDDGVTAFGADTGKVYIFNDIGECIVIVNAHAAGLTAMCSVLEHENAAFITGGADGRLNFWSEMFGVCLGSYNLGDTNEVELGLARGQAASERIDYDVLGFEPGNEQSHPPKLPPDQLGKVRAVPKSVDHFEGQILVV